MAAEASVIIRFTNKSPHRVQNLMSLIRHISKNPKVEIIISAMEADVQYPPDIAKLFKGRKKKAKLIHNYENRPFASTVANNIGAALANTNILIFQDADILFDNINYDKIINRIKNKGVKAVRVGEDCLNLSVENTKAIHKEVKSGKMQKLPNLLKQMETSGRGCRDAPGACTAISKKAFVEIGGWSELFLVYGWEDCYFRYKVRKLGKEKYVSLQAPMVHLAHEVNYQSGHQAKNNHLYSQIISANPTEYQSLLDRDRKDLLIKYPKLDQAR
jgi:GT2 family glycosyltransferase